MFFDVQRKHEHVRCTNGGCPAKPKAIIPYQTVAPGIVQIPRNLACTSCGFQVFIDTCDCQEEK